MKILQHIWPDLSKYKIENRGLDGCIFSSTIRQPISDLPTIIILCFQWMTPLRIVLGKAIYLLRKLLKDLTVTYLAKFSVCTNTFRYTRARVQTSHLLAFMIYVRSSLIIHKTSKTVASSVKWSVAMTFAIGRCCRLILLCVVLLVISVMSANFKGEIQSCSGWRLNHLPEVRRFLKEVRVVLFEKRMLRCCSAKT